MKNRMSRSLFWLVVICLSAAPLSTAAAGDFLYVPVSNAVHVIDCSVDSVVKTINAYDDYIVTGGHSADGKRFYACGWESIYAFDTATNELVDTYNFSSPLSKVAVGGFAVSNDGTKLYLAANIVKKKQNVPRLNVLPPQIVVYDMKKRKVLKSYEVPSGVIGVLPVRKDPNSLILMGLDVYKLNLKNGKIETILGGLHPEEGQAPRNINTANTNSSPGDHGLVVAPFYTMTEAGPEMGYAIVDTNDGTVTTVMGEHPWFEYSVRVSPDGKYMFAAMDELIKIDIKTGKTLGFVSIEKGTVYCVAVSSDGKKVYVGPGGPDISVYDADTLELLGVIPLDADGKVSHLIPR